MAVVPVVPYKEVPLVGSATAELLSLRQACESQWVIVQIDTKAAKAPLAVTIQFSGGEGPPGVDLKLIVSRSTLVCLPSSAIVVRGTNLGTATTTVTTRIHQTNLPLATRNVWSSDGDATGVLDTIEIPAYAESVRLDVADVAFRATSYLELFSPGAVLVGRSSVTDLPPRGLPVGHSEQAGILVPAAANKYRVTWFLSV